MYILGAIIVGLSGGGGGEERVQSQIRNFMVWIFMGSNLSLRGSQHKLEIWSALGAILGLFYAYLGLVVK